MLMQQGYSIAAFAAWRIPVGSLYPYRAFLPTDTGYRKERVIPHGSSQGRNTWDRWL